MTKFDIRRRLRVPGGRLIHTHFPHIHNCAPHLPHLPFPLSPGTGVESGDFGRDGWVTFGRLIDVSAVMRMSK